MFCCGLEIKVFLIRLFPQQDEHIQDPQPGHQPLCEEDKVFKVVMVVEMSWFVSWYVITHNIFKW